MEGTYNMVIENLFIGKKEFLSYQKVFNANESVITDMVRFQKPEIKYSMSAIPIGRIRKSLKPHVIDLSHSKRILILGMTGSGKSVLCGSIMDRFKKSGGLLSIFDLKGEYIVKSVPLKDKFSDKYITNANGEKVRTYLFNEETPQGFELKSYYPVFLKNIMAGSTLKDKNRPLFENESLCQFGMESLTKTDFFTFFETITNRNSSYFEYLEELWLGIERDSLSTWEDIVSFIEDHDVFSKSTRKNLIRNLTILKDNEVLGNAYDPPDLITDLKENRIGILNLKGIINLPVTTNPALVYVNILLRKIYNSKVIGDVSTKKHNLIFVDEVNKFVPRLGSNPSKDEFLKLLDLVRSEHISMMYSTQDWRRIPETLIKQADYVFLPFNIDLDDLAEIVKLVLPSEYHTPQTFKTKMSHLQSMMKIYKDGRRDWLMIDKINKKRVFFTPVLPLSYFLEEGEKAENVLSS